MSNQQQHIAIIGGGPAGLEAATCLGAAGYRVTLFEKEKQTGGKLLLWYKLFPTFRPASEVREYLVNGCKILPPTIHTNTTVVGIQPNQHQHQIVMTDGQSVHADAVLIATGYDVFNAEKKEEYGYQIYNNVITSVDLEAKFKSGEPIKTTDGQTPHRIAIIHCVGSRDKKSGNVYCSRVCCITGVKQAIELKQHLPEAEIFNFYMDLRMFGQDFEELYTEAQQKWGVTFIRGRVSEIAEDIEGKLQLKAEDTLSGRPIKMNFDLVVLLVGIVSPKASQLLATSANLSLTPSNFMACQDVHLHPNETNTPGIFVTGTCKEPLSVTETLADARSAAIRMIAWLKDSEQKQQN